MSCASAILVELQNVRQGTGHLRHFNSVRQAVAEVVGKARREDLRLSFQAPEGARVHDAIAIALETISIRMFGLRVSPSPALIHRKPQAGQHRAAASSASRRGR
jgi:hypothetical protein